MRQRLLAYRWEIALVVAIPMAARIVHFVVLHGGTFVFGVTDTMFVVAALASTATSAALLGILYRRVRHAARDLVALLWGLALITSLISVVALATVVAVDSAFPGADRLALFGRRILIYGVAALPSFAVFLWFARQASRLSLSHMCFVVAWVYPAQAQAGTSLPPDDGSVLPVQLTLYIVGSVVGLAVMLLKVWLLGNFDRRTQRFRRNAVLILIVAAFASSYSTVLVLGLDRYVGSGFASVFWLLSWPDVLGFIALITDAAIGLLGLAALFGIAYLVRVRSPKAQAGVFAE